MLASLVILKTVALAIVEVEVEVVEMVALVVVVVLLLLSQVRICTNISQTSIMLRLPGSRLTEWQT